MLMIIEPFYGGSHKQLIDIVTKDLIKEEFILIQMKAKKWHWRARASALWLAQNIPDSIENVTVLFCSSVLNLCELVGLRSEFNAIRKIMYFHENQLVYPVQQIQDRDFQYGYNQILSALVADELVFNSEYNLNSFLDNISKHFKPQPDYKPNSSLILSKLKQKSSVLYFPIYEELKNIPSFIKNCDNINKVGSLRIVWSHRWEHDKNPDSFFSTMSKLKHEGLDFRLIVLGESYSECPDAISKVKGELDSHIDWFGYAESNEYYELLAGSDVVVSTAYHETFGVAMLEAAYLGCYPLAPNRLVYPEIYPTECLYNTDIQLYNKLKCFILNPSLVRSTSVFIDFSKFNVDSFKSLLVDR